MGGRFGKYGNLKRSKALQLLFFLKKSPHATLPP
jgi:hypothetical protein